MKKIKKIRKGMRGQAIVEMAFLFIFFVLLVMIIMQYSLFLLAAQRAESLTREGVQAAFHDCRSLTGADRLGCLNAAATRLQNLLTYTMGSSVNVNEYAIFFTSWEFIDIGDGQGKRAQKTPGDNPIIVGGLSGEGVAAKFTDASSFDVKGQDPNKNYNLIARKGELFTCEIFYRHPWFSGGSPGSIFYYFANNLLFNKTIYSCSVA